MKRYCQHNMPSIFYMNYCNIFLQDQVPYPANKDKMLAEFHKVVDCVIPYLPQITYLLINPPHKPPVPTTMGVLKVPLGRVRLSLAKLVSTLLSTNHGPLNSALVKADTLTVLLDLFFEYSLNNLLHTHVESCVHRIVFWKEKTDLDLTPPENPALVNLLTNACLVERLISTWTNTN